MSRIISIIFQNKLLQGASLGGVVSLLIALMVLSGMFVRVDFAILDFFYRNRDKEQVVIDDRITLLTIFDDSLALSRWPWSWDKFDECFKAMHLYGSRLGVILEDTFGELGSITIKRDAAKLKRQDLGAKIDSLSPDQLEKELNQLAPDYNEKLVKTLKAYGGGILSQTFVVPDNQDPQHVAKEEAKRKKGFIKTKIKAIEAMRKFGQKWEDPGKLLRAVDVTPIIPELSESIAGLGFNRIIQDADGLVRRAATVVYYDGSIFFSHGIVASAKFLGCKISDIEVVPGKHLKFKGIKAKATGEDLAIPIDESGMMYINWTQKDQLKSFNTFPFNLIQIYMAYDKGKKLLAGREYGSKEYGLGHFQKQFDIEVMNSGMASQGYMGDILYKLMMAWFCSALVEQEIPIHQALNYFQKVFGDNLVGFHFIRIYDSIRINFRTIEHDPEEEGELNHRAFMKEMGIHGGEIASSHIYSFLGSQEEAVAAEKLKEEDAFNEEVFANLAEKGFFKESERNKEGGEDDIYVTQHIDLSRDEYADKLIKEGFAKSKEDAEKKSLFYFFDLAKDSLKIFEHGVKKVAHFTAKDKLEHVAPLYFYEPEEILLKGKNQPVSLLNLHNQAVFIGLTATGLNAQNPTPYAQRDTMTSMGPALLNIVLTEKFIKKINNIEIPLILALGIVMFTLTIMTKIYISLPVLALLMIGHFALGFKSFENSGNIIPVFSPMLSMLFSFVGALLFQYWEQQKERKKIRGMFSAMVSPEVLKLLEEDPDKFTLAGEKMEASMFSSDVSGFTTISEGVTAQELANILNLYLTPMSNLVMTYGGYVEKYEGDAIKADFGLPMPDPDHAWKACFSALLQQEELNVVQRMLQLKYGVMIKARMGVNTGTVSAGNMGSENKMQYCALGEAVAMAEELEPSNKMWETWIAIGPETYEYAKNHLITRLLDNVIFPHETIPVYEVLGWKKDKFLNFWEGKPIPKLDVEGWEKIIPEKVLAYLDYYRERSDLPANQFKQLLIDTYQSLEETCIEKVQTQDKMDVFALEKDFQDIQGKLSSYDRDKILNEISDIDKNDLNRYVEANEKADEAWRKQLTSYQLELRKSSYVVSGILGQVEKPIYDQYEGIVDALEKRVVCFMKRIEFPDEKDRYGNIFADHLKKLLQSPGGNINEADIPGLEKKRDEDLAKVKKVMAEFIVKAKPMSVDFHQFTAAHCLVSDNKSKVLDIFAEGRELYLDRKWDEATQKFNEGLELVDDDGPCLTYIDRCKDFSEKPPEDGWKGDWEADW